MALARNPKARQSRENPTRFQSLPGYMWTMREFAGIGLTTTAPARCVETRMTWGFDHGRMWTFRSLPRLSTSQHCNLRMAMEKQRPQAFTSVATGVCDVCCTTVQASLREGKDVSRKRSLCCLCSPPQTPASGLWSKGNQSQEAIGLTHGQPRRPRLRMALSQVSRCVGAESSSFGFGDQGQEFKQVEVVRYFGK